MSEGGNERVLLSSINAVGWVDRHRAKGVQKCFDTVPFKMRPPAKAVASTASRDRPDGFQGSQDGRWCRKALQSPPCHRLAALGAGLRQI